MNIITILAYKANGVHTRRCCVVDQWDSDFETFTTVDLQAAIKWLAEIQDRDRKQFKGSYEFNVLINGADENTWLDGEEEEAYDARVSLITEVNAGAALVLAQIVEDEKQAEIRAVEARRVAAECKKIADAEAAEQQEQELLQKLAAKHGMAVVKA